MITKLEYKIPSEGIDAYISHSVDILCKFKDVIILYSQLFPENKSFGQYWILINPAGTDNENIEVNVVASSRKERGFSAKQIPSLYSCFPIDSLKLLDKCIVSIFDILKLAGEEMEHSEVIIEYKMNTDEKYTLYYQDIYNYFKIYSIIGSIHNAAIKEVKDLNDFKAIYDRY